MVNAVALGIYLVVSYHIRELRGAKADQRTLVEHGHMDNMAEEPGPVECHVEEHAEYDGDQLSWGFGHSTNDAAGCCDKCKQDSRCHLWSWCAAEGGCGPNHSRGACWTKRFASNPDFRNITGARGPEVPFTSGACFASNRRWEKQAAIAAEQDSEEVRLVELAADDSQPLVYFDVAIKGKPAGRMTFVLFTKDAPRAAENYRLLFSGERGIVPEGKRGAGKPWSFEGVKFYRIYDRFICQSGAEVDTPLLGNSSTFKDDPGSLQLVHDRKGLLSIANAGPDTNSAHFSIMMGPFPHNDKHYGVFGELVSGWDVVQAVNLLARGVQGNELKGSPDAVIVAAGQLRRGVPVNVTSGM